jgi:hypothetical protein
MLIPFVIVPLYSAHAATLPAFTISALGSVFQTPFTPIPTPIPSVSNAPLSLPTSIRVEGFAFDKMLITELLSALHAKCSADTSVASSGSGSATTSQGTSTTTVSNPITFSSDNYGQWVFTSGFNHSTAWMAYLNPNNTEAAALTADPVDSQIPTSLPIEALLVDTSGNYLVDRCPAATYTGNAATDLACIAAEAKAQNYNYVLGQHAALSQ